MMTDGPAILSAWDLNTSYNCETQFGFLLNRIPIRNLRILFNFIERACEEVLASVVIRAQSKSLYATNITKVF